MFCVVDCVLHMWNARDMSGSFDVYGLDAIISVHICLLIQSKRPIHVVCSPKDEFLVIITVYLPDERRWGTDWKARKKRD